MTNGDQSERGKEKHHVVHTVCGHAILCVALFVIFLWLVPRFVLPFEDLLGSPPIPFVVVADVSDFVARFLLILLPATAVFLWSDARLCRKLSSEGRESAFSLWSAAVVLVLVGGMLWVLYALSTPSVEAHRIHQHQLEQTKE